MRAVAKKIVHPLVSLATDELHRGPWVYARHVDVPRGEAPPDGALVEVVDRSARFIGHAFYNGSSDIRLRFVSRGRRTALDRPREFFGRKLRAADALRRKTLRLERETDAYRIVHAEGDDLPGLIVDRLGKALVCEVHALGVHRERELFLSLLRELYPDFPITYRVPPSVLRSEGFDYAGEETHGGESWITENGLRFPVRLAGGHKTGWFCDQRDNRMKVARLAEGRDVVDLCCNAGGFALQAKRAGARSVLACDLDEKCLETAQQAAQANGLDVQFRHQDAFPFLRELAAQPPGARPGLVILDPPKLILGRAGLEAGRKKYADFNALAVSAVQPGGLVASFSCSGALDLPTYLGLVFGAARRAEREVRLLDVLGPAPDHPQRPDWPRSRYLKGVLLAVDRN